VDLLRFLGRVAKSRNDRLVSLKREPSESPLAKSYEHGASNAVVTARAGADGTAHQRTKAS
jgi:hypothetical protein